jgi:EpsI family protein
VTVNRYLLQNEGQRALVLYWYQGRGRVAHNEYAVKWDLLRDAALHRRSEEALVRVVVPVVESEGAAFELARSVASELIPFVQRALPDAALGQGRERPANSRS